MSVIHIFSTPETRNILKFTFMENCRSRFYRTYRRRRRTRRSAQW